MQEGEIFAIVTRQYAANICNVLFLFTSSMADYIPTNTPDVPPSAHAPVVQWRIEGAQNVDPVELKPYLTDDPRQAGNDVVRVYKEHGILAIKVRIEGTETERVLLITEGRLQARGKYAAWLPEGDRVTQDGLRLAIARAQDAAKANNESLYVQVGKVNEQGGVEVVLGGTPNPDDGTRWVGSASSFGPRYSGSDAMSLVYSKPMGNGVFMDASATVGLPGLRSDSRGGHYVGVNVGLSKATSYGLFSARVSQTQFKVGGDNRDLDQNGQVTKLDGEWSYVMQPGLTSYAGLGYTRQRSSIGMFDWDDTIGSTALKAGLRLRQTHQKWNYGGDLGIEQGLSLQRTVRAPGLLLGEIDAHYSLASINADATLQVPEWYGSLSLSVGGQKGSSGTPTGSQFYVGGPGRGLSYHTGVYSAASGYYGGIQWTTVPWRDISAFLGLEGGVVLPEGFDSVSAKSVHLGARFALPGRVMGQLGYASPIGDTAAKGRMTFFLSGQF